jgi:hypothetical protein
MGWNISKPSIKFNNKILIIKNAEIPDDVIWKN